MLHSTQFTNNLINTHSLVQTPLPHTICSYSVLVLYLLAITCSYEYIRQFLKLPFNHTAFSFYMDCAQTYIIVSLTLTRSLTHSHSLFLSFWCQLLSLSIEKSHSSYICYMCCLCVDLQIRDCLSRSRRRMEAALTLAPPRRSPMPAAGQSSRARSRRTTAAASCACATSRCQCSSSSATSSASGSPITA